MPEPTWFVVETIAMLCIFIAAFVGYKLGRRKKHE
jgi:hypothetical protein